jgi:hypothetical protein
MARRWRLTSPRCLAVRLKAPREAAGLFFSYHTHSPIFLLHHSDVFWFSKPDSRQQYLLHGPIEPRRRGGWCRAQQSQVRECLQHAEHCARQSCRSKGGPGASGYSHERTETLRDRDDRKTMDRPLRRGRVLMPSPQPPVRAIDAQLPKSR